MDGEAWGSIGFVAGQERDWQTAEIDAVRVVANTLGAAIGRQRAAQRLHEAESRYRRLIETIPAATYIDTVGRDLPGDLHEPSGGAHLRLHARGVARTARRCGRRGCIRTIDDEVVARVERHNREGVPYEAEYRFRHRDGRWVWVHDEAVMILDEEGAPRLSQGVIFDITPLKHHEEQLRETEERFRGIVEHVPSAIYLDSAGPGMESLYISPQIERIAGVSPEEWLADPELWLRPRCTPTIATSVRDSYLAAAAAGRAWSAEYRMQTRDGRTIWVHDETTFLHDEEGNATFMQGVISDITERRLAEQALRESRAARARGRRAPASARRDEEHVPRGGLPRAAQPADVDPGAVARRSSGRRSSTTRTEGTCWCACPRTPASWTGSSRTCWTSTGSTAASWSRSTARWTSARSPGARSRASSRSPNAHVIVDADPAPAHRRPREDRAHPGEPADERGPPHGPRPADLAPRGPARRTGR